MSHKIAKRIRKQLGYDPKASRNYLKGKNTGILMVAPSDLRRTYQDIKRGKHE